MSSPDTSANLLSTKVIEELDVALARFSISATKAVEEPQQEIARRIQTLEDERLHASNEVRQWQNRIDNADEDEGIGAFVDRRNVAEHEAREIERVQARVEEAFYHYRTAMAELKVLSTDSATQARAFLYQKEVDIQGYLAAQLGSAGASSAGAATAARVNSVTGNTGPGGQAITSLDIHLPAGYKWVPIEEIDRTKLLKREDMPDGSYDEFANRLKILQAKVLPILKSNPEAGIDHFQDLDRRLGLVTKDGLVHPKSLERTYELFFESDYIRLTRMPGAPHYDVANGRHRISVARDLGWAAIPVIVEGDGSS